MTLFYETNIWSKHRQYLQQCEKKNFDADKSLYALKKSFNSSWGEETGNNANPADVTAKMKRLRWANGHK